MPVTEPVTELPLTGTPLSVPLNFERVGMPSLDSVGQAIPFTPTSGRTTYHVLRTTEFDSYERSSAATAVADLLRKARAPSASDLAAALNAAPAAPVSDNFAGTARKAAKLSIAQAQTEELADVAALIATLPPDKAMKNHDPKITTDATSERVQEEERNVRLKGFLYAASREEDNDFHLIVGRDPTATPAMYMTMEVSGLPPTSDASFARLEAARDSFKTFFGANLPQMTYDFYDPPIPVVIEGSLFFDMSHATGQRPGPPSLKSHMPTIWEVHPVTAITLG
jgi:hypothetical protein